jgi:hypothetical protein
VPLFLEGDSTVQQERCGDCGQDYVLVKSFIRDSVGPHAVSFSALHIHDRAHEAWIDVVFGSFEGPAEREQRVTFGCRVGPVVNSPEPAATAVQAATPYADSATFGRKLGREEALAHSRLGDFWDVVDFVLAEEPTVNHHVYAHFE